ncbi:transposase domain-containing protein [Natronincola ferrireducens]|uniref:IS66 C-terminal element n=1 Tax=Natronincola ferrireducens TaxID=393762 RepID=A0A1G9DXE5_9FIRM|nr:transposase domain-containing protein [Natronincola ferrireducens]SDK68545.1 IS66 C-terminal element [Natronincola ferrireducens]
MVYSLVETAKANGLNPYKYLQLLLTTLPKMPFQKDKALLDNLLPWDPKVQEICKTRYKILENINLTMISRTFLFFEVFVWKIIKILILQECNVSVT